MLPDRVSNPGPLTYESGALPIALRGPVTLLLEIIYTWISQHVTLRGINSKEVGACQIFRFSVLCMHKLPGRYSGGRMICPPSPHTFERIIQVNVF